MDYKLEERDDNHERIYTVESLLLPPQQLTASSGFMGGDT